MQCLNQLELFAELKWASSQIVLNLGLGMGMRMRIHAVHADDADMRIAMRMLKILMRISRIQRKK